MSRVLFKKYNGLYCLRPLGRVYLEKKFKSFHGRISWKCLYHFHTFSSDRKLLFSDIALKEDLLERWTNEQREQFEEWFRNITGQFKVDRGSQEVFDPSVKKHRKKFAEAYISLLDHLVNWKRRYLGGDFQDRLTLEIIASIFLCTLSSERVLLKSPGKLRSFLRLLDTPATQVFLNTSNFWRYFEHAPYCNGESTVTPFGNVWLHAAGQNLFDALKSLR